MVVPVTAQEAGVVPETTAVNEAVVVAAFAVLVIVVALLTYLLGRALPALHESVSDKTMYRVLAGFQPEFARLSGEALEHMGEALATRAAQTPNPVDDRLATMLDELLGPVVARLDELEVRQAYAEGRTPDDDDDDDTAPVAAVDPDTQFGQLGSYTPGKSWT